MTKKASFWPSSVSRNNSRSESLEEDVDANFESDILKEQNAHKDSLEIFACAKEGVVSGFVSFRFVSFPVPAFITCLATLESQRIISVFNWISGNSRIENFNPRLDVLFY